MELNDRLYLEENLRIKLIKNYENAKTTFLLLGREITKYLYIVDPYLDDPVYIEDLLFPCQDKISEIRILFNYNKSVHSGNNYKDIRGLFYENFSLRQNRINVFLKSMCDVVQNIIPFHDRFIITENRCWSLGTSFRNIGVGTQSYLIDVDFHLNLKGSHIFEKRSEIIKEDFHKMWDNLTNTITFDYEEFQF